MNNVIKYKDYYATLQYNAENETFHGKILGINDNISFEGSSVKKLKAAFEEALDAYIAKCKQKGKEPEKTYKGSFNVRISPILHREAAFTALQNNTTLNEFVQSAIKYAVKHKDAVTKG